MSVEDDILAHEVRALADAGESWREHLVPALLQKIGHAPPAPAAMPGAVHKQEGLRRAGLRRCWRAAQSGCARAGPCACQHAAAGHRYVVSCSHRVLPTCCFWRNLTWHASVRPEQRTRKTRGHPSLAHLTRPPAHPVDNRDNRPPSQQRPARAYTGRSSESPGSLHALSASVP